MTETPKAKLLFALVKANDCECGLGWNLTTAEWAIMVTLADRWNAEKGYAYPSVETIGQVTGLHRNTVGPALTKLERREPPLILVDRKRKRGNHYSFPRWLFELAERWDAKRRQPRNHANNDNAQPLCNSDAKQGADYAQPLCNLDADDHREYAQSLIEYAQLDGPNKHNPAGGISTTTVQEEPREKPKERPSKDLERARVIAEAATASNPPAGKRARKPRRMAREPSPPAAAPAAKAQRGAHLPDDWEPEPFAAGSRAALAVAGWSADELADELERFRCHWGAAAGQNSRKRNWQQAWQNWTLRALDFRRGGRRSAGPADKPDPLADMFAELQALKAEAAREDVDAAR